MTDRRDDVTPATTTDHTTTGSSTTGRPVTAARPGYGDARATTTTTTTKRSSMSWIGIVVAVLAVIILGSWLFGGFDGREETAMMVNDPVVEMPADTNSGAVIVAPVDEEPEAVAPTTEQPAEQPVQQ